MSYYKSLELLLTWLASRARTMWPGHKRREIRDGAYVGGRREGRRQETVPRKIHHLLAKNGSRFSRRRNAPCRIAWWRNDQEQHAIHTFGRKAAGFIYQVGNPGAGRHRDGLLIGVANSSRTLPPLILVWLYSTVVQVESETGRRLTAAEEISWATSELLGNSGAA
jgi:hypothetical protein